MIASLAGASQVVQLAGGIVSLVIALTVWDNRRHIRRIPGSRRSARRKRDSRNVR